MSRILLLVDYETNRRMLSATLEDSYDIVVPRHGADLDADYDLGIVGGQALARLRDAIVARKQREEPVLLPFMLVSSRQDVNLSSSGLWRVIDEVVTVPVERVELRARLTTLLRSRTLSLELERRNEDLRMLIRALSHDLRAPARYAQGFAEALREDYGGLLDGRGLHYLDRISEATERTRNFLDVLLAYARLSGQLVSLRPVQLEDAARSALSHVHDSLVEAGGTIHLEGRFPTVRADPEMIDLALTNLLSNAIKFVAPGTQPRIVVSTRVEDGNAWLEVRDNGVGIPSGALQRIFEPLVRLYGEESYEGTGLGLAIVQRATALMGGEVTVSSVPGEGSTFRIRLPLEHEVNP